MKSSSQRINYAAPYMYAVISDIHGNLEALEAVLRDMPEDVETVYCLGDVIGYGANPDECCDVVRKLGMPTISGNHDLAVTDLETDLDWFNPVGGRGRAVDPRAPERGERRVLAHEAAHDARRDDALFVHGSVRDPDEYIINSDLRARRTWRS